MDPAKPVEETEGTAEFTMSLGGRYLEEKFEMWMPGPDGKLWQGFTRQK